jgi:hypothetical protein
LSANARCLRLERAGLLFGKLLMGRINRCKLCYKGHIDGQSAEMKTIQISLLIGWYWFAIPASKEMVGLKLTGNWISLAAEKTGTGNYSIREFRFTNRNWQVRATVFADSLMQDAIFTFRAVGTYTIGAPSSNLTATYNATFFFGQKFLTLKSTDTMRVKSTGLSSCDLKPGVETDITTTGCSYFASRTACGMEFDLVSLENGILRLGERPASGGMCSEDRRPVRLGPPLKKIK